MEDFKQNDLCPGPGQWNAWHISRKMKNLGTAETCVPQQTGGEGQEGSLGLSCEALGVQTEGFEFHSAAVGTQTGFLKQTNDINSLGGRPC